MFNNGHNCGRWVRVRIGDDCVGGQNDGSAGKGFCRGGTWKSDRYTGAMLDMVVADSCGDPNSWCRTDPVCKVERRRSPRKAFVQRKSLFFFFPSSTRQFHIDLAQPAINRFIKDGKPVGTMLDHWSNRQVYWEFITHPHYKGDIKIGFMRGAQPFWTAVAFTNLYNGIHGVEFRQGDKWTAARMDADMGQAYIIEGTKKGGSDYAVRVRDVDDKYVHGGRVYKFSLPSACGSGGCVESYLAVNYTTEEPGGEAKASGDKGSE